MTDDPRVREPSKAEMPAPERRRRDYRYTAEQRAEGVALAATVGPNKAAEALAIPHQTISGWMTETAASPVIAEAERTIAQRLREAHAEALDLVMEGLRDPKARLLDRARALEVLGTQLALAEGRATANLNMRTVNGVDPDVTEGWRLAMSERTWEERCRAMDILDAILEEDAQAPQAAVDDPVAHDEQAQEADDPVDDGEGPSPNPWAALAT